VFPLHAILDIDAASRAGYDPAALGRIFFDAGARLVQLRAKQLASRPFLELADALVRDATAYEAAVIVNDRVDIARLSGAAGAHVGQTDLPPAAARRLLGPGAVIGYSTHSTGQVDAAAREPVSYIAVGPVFGTGSKDTGYAPVGLDLVRSAARQAAGMPIVAIGGITLETAPEVIAAGAAAVAVISDLLAGGDPARRIQAYLRALDRRR
jgi:thiamine-phosphate pyrophosphorylase